MFDCITEKELISLYIDNELSEEDKIEFENHLLNCESCRQDVSNLTFIVNAVKDINEVELPENFHEEIMNKIKFENKKKVSFFNIQNFKKFTYAAAILLITVIGVDLNKKFSENNNLNNINQPTSEETTPDSGLSRMAPSSYSLNNEDLSLEENKNLRQARIESNDILLEDDKQESVSKSVNSTYILDEVSWSEYNINILMDNLKENFDSFIGDITSVSITDIKIEKNFSDKIDYKLTFRIDKDEQVYQKLIDIINRNAKINEINQKENNQTEYYKSCKTSLSEKILEQENLYLNYENALNNEDKINIQKNIDNIQNDIQYYENILIELDQNNFSNEVIINIVK